MVVKFESFIGEKGKFLKDNKIIDFLTSSIYSSR